MLAVSLGGAEDRPAALVPPALAASAAAADREGQALLARRDKAAHAVVAALQVRLRRPPPELPASIWHQKLPHWQGVVVCVHPLNSAV